jgi:hypothetical protein
MQSRQSDAAALSTLDFSSAAFEDGTGAAKRLNG